MTSATCATPLTFDVVTDYWSGDLQEPEIDRVDDHVFSCDRCARALATGEALMRSVNAVIQAGSFQAVVTDTLLNRLARNGVRIRTFIFEPGIVMPCAAWPDDDLIVARLRADLTGIETVDVVVRMGSGDELVRVTDVPVNAASREIINAFSAVRLRQIPSSRVSVTVTGHAGHVARPIGEYLLEHTHDPARASQ